MGAMVPPSRKSCYNFRVVSIDRVVDGDTIDVTIDLGFDLYKKERVRVAGVDTPEKRTRDLDEKKKGFSLGAADYLSKPVERDRLIGSIGKLLGSKPGKVIMVVEDNEDLRFTVKEALLSADHVVLEASNGKEALDCLRDKSKENPDLILLDLMMPKMNGFEFLETYRSEFENQAPIVVITGADLDENDKKFLSSETTRVLEKSSMTDTGIADELVNTIASLAGISQ